MAWTGDNQTVVVIDTGWGTGFSEDARGTVIAEYDFHDGDGDAASGRAYSHGGAVGATILGVAPEVDLVHLKVFADQAGYTYETIIEDALDWVIDHAESLDIAAVNLSLGGGNHQAAPATGRLADEFAALDALGVIPVAAAGNSYGLYGSDGVGNIAAYDPVIGVSATDRTGVLTDWSQRDPALTDIAALGDSVPIDTGDGITAWSGTSFSAPQVTAAIALLNQASQTLRGEEITADAALDWMRRTGDRFGNAEGFVELDTDGLMTAFTAAHGGDAATDWLV